MIWNLLHCLVLETWLGEGGNEEMTDDGAEAPARNLMGWALSDGGHLLHSLETGHTC